jgi:hypothetical protein
VLPQVKVILPEVDLGLNQLVRVLEQLLEKFLERFANDRGVNQRRLIALLLAFQIVLQKPLALFDNLGQILGQLVEIDVFEIGGGWGGHGNTSILQDG